MSPTFCDPMDCRPPGSSVIGIPQARILKWLAISSSRVSSPPRDGTWVFSIAGEGHNGHNVCDIRDLANAGWPIFLFCPEPRRTLECYTSSPKMGEVPGKPRQAGHRAKHLYPVKDKRMDGAHEGSDWTTPQSWGHVPWVSKAHSRKVWWSLGMQKKNTKP